MKEWPQSSLQLRRGLVAAILGTAAGAAISGAIVLAPLICRRFYPGPEWWKTTEYFSSDLAKYWPGPVLGVAVFFGCAAWATYAPSGLWRFARSLAIVFVISFVSWIVVGWVNDGLHLEMFRRLKGHQDDAPTLAEVLAGFGPPVVAAQMLVALRLRQTGAIRGARPAFGGSGSASN